MREGQEGRALGRSSVHGGPPGTSARDRRGRPRARNGIRAGNAPVYGVKSIATALLAKFGTSEPSIEA